MPFNVISLFDGMSCGRQALDRAGICYDTYYSSEVDKHAVKVTAAKYPDSIQLGDVRAIDVSRLKSISMVIGGSPCQSFSFAGKMNGMTTKESQEILSLEHYLELKGLGFEFEGQSYLFWEFVRILTEVRKYNPECLFLLENVKMQKKWQAVLTKALGGVEPVEINSALVCAQNRKRLYWTNIGKIAQPADRGIYLKDILETDVDEKYYLSDKMVNYLNTRKGNFNGGKINYKYPEDKASTICKSSSSIDISDNIIVDTQRKARCFTAGANSGSNSGGLHSQMDTICVAQRGRNPDNPKSRVAGLPTEQMLEPKLDGKTFCLTTVQKDNLVLERNRTAEKLRTEEDKSTCLGTRGTNPLNSGTPLFIDRKPIQLNPSVESNGQQPYQQNRVYNINGIMPTLQTHAQPKILDGYRIRRLTPIECCRLQTVDDDYFFDENGNALASDTQMYRMLGNGWTIDAISHIFSFIIQDLL